MSWIFALRIIANDSKKDDFKGIKGRSKYYPVVALTGPRQSGKSTFLKNVLPDYRYVSLENPDNRDFASKDPNGFLALYDQKVIIDEVQLVPHLFSYIQTIVDDQMQIGQYVLSGSQNFQLFASIRQSLAGRVAMYKLFPFDVAELKSADLLPIDYEILLLRGCYLLRQ